MGLPIINYVNDSFIEFSPYWSFVLFTKGCNLACKECYNLKYMGNSPIGDAIDILETNLKRTHEAVVFLGGEPTIHGINLIEAVQYCKNRNLFTKLYSNGQHPGIIKHLNNQKLVDAYSFDIKIVKGSVENTLGVGMLTLGNYLANLDDSIQNCLSKNIQVEIRTTLWDCVKEQKEDIKKYVKEHYPMVMHIFQEKFLFVE